MAQSSTESLRIQCDDILKDFQNEAKKFKYITVNVQVKYYKNNSLVRINCAIQEKKTGDKKWFFHTISRFTDDNDFHNFQCLLMGLRQCFPSLKAQ